MFGVKRVAMMKFVRLLCLMVVRWVVVRGMVRAVLGVLGGVFFKGRGLGWFLGFLVLVRLCLCLLGGLHTL